MSSTHPAQLISEFVDDADMRELVDLFVSELPQRIEAIRGALGTQRYRDLQRLAHQLKGAAGGYGFPTIGAAAGVLEGTLKQNDEPPVARLRGEVDALIALCNRAAGA
ncbi:MAG: Hpt domain-containing protein [Phycisphaerales bacterium]|nr:Hpt domain-containing protein [Phycisphaerales bacterium]MCB9840735.1 Hpt domain-containing protein [Phycisphaeraceae bacterium]